VSPLIRSGAAYPAFEWDRTGADISATDRFIDKKTRILSPFRVIAQNLKACLLFLSKD
jgi:hypothetical protein